MEAGETDHLHKGRTQTQRGTLCVQQSCHLSCAAQCYHLVVTDALCMSFMFTRGEDTKGDEAAFGEVAVIFLIVFYLNYKKHIFPLPLRCNHGNTLA